MKANPPELDPLYLITDRDCARRGLGPLAAVVEAALEAGARFFQFREKNLSAAETWEIGERLAEHFIDAGASFLVNDRADIALGLEADGVHRPSHGLPVGVLESVLGERGIVGASAHDLEEARAAQEAGADFVTVSPVFPSPSKPDYGPILEPSGLGSIAGQVDIPVYALGGIIPGRVERCLDAGAYGVAVMSGVMAAERPKRATRSYLEALELA